MLLKSFSLSIFIVALALLLRNTNLIIRSRPRVGVIFNDDPQYNSDYANFYSLYLSNRYSQICAEPVESNTDFQELKDFDVLLTLLHMEELEKFQHNLNIIHTTNASMIISLDHKDEVRDLIPEDHLIQEIPSLYITEETTQRDIERFGKKFDVKKILCKPADGRGSKEQKVFDISTFIDGKKIDLSNDIGALCQLFLQPHDVIAVDLFANDGKIHNYIAFKEFGGLPREAYASEIYSKVMLNFNMIFNEIDQEYWRMMWDFIYKMVEVYRLQGFFEFEFLVYKDQIFFLEINPRTTGYSAAFDQMNHNPYIDVVLGSYIQHFVPNLVIPKRWHFWKDIHEKGHFVITQGGGALRDKFVGDHVYPLGCARDFKEFKEGLMEICANKLEEYVRAFKKISPV